MACCCGGVGWCWGAGSADGVSILIFTILFLYFLGVGWGGVVSGGRFGHALAPMLGAIEEQKKALEGCFDY